MSQTETQKLTADVHVNNRRATDGVHVNVQSVSALAWIFGVIGWLAGIALAKGWMTLIAVAFFPYGWYLAVERIMLVTGLL